MVYTLGATKFLCEAAQMTRLIHELIVKRGLASGTKVAMNISFNYFCIATWVPLSYRDKFGKKGCWSMPILS